MTKRALVLAGGGIAGIAWETGILQGIADEAPEVAAAVRNSDVVLGTSAGSAVGAQLGSALSIGELFERQVAAESAEISPGINIEAILTTFIDAMSSTNGSRADQLQRLGAAAAAAETVSPEVRRNVIERRYCHIKQWRGLATRYDKHAVVYRAAVVLNAVLAWTKTLSDTP